MKRPFSAWHEMVLLALLAGLMIAAYAVEPVFVSWKSQRNLSSHLWELAILTIPMTLIIITAGIDLSVGSMLALSAVALGLLVEAGVSPWLGAAAALIAGGAAGALNGLVVTKLRVHPLIVTLATMAVYRGMAEGISLGRPLSGFPEAFAVVGRGTFLGVPIPGWLFAAAALVAAVALARTAFGRALYAMGHNETAARFSGIPVDRIKLFLYTVSGAAAGATAVILVSRQNTAKADLGLGMDLDVITAVVLGGTSLFGGRGGIGGTVLGVLLIHETREFVSWHWNKAELNLIVIGVLLIVAVLLHHLLSPRRREE